MNMTRWLAASALALASVQLSAAPASTFDPARFNEHVKTLGSDAFEGRGPATEGETRTVNYLTEQCRAAGLHELGRWDLIEAVDLVDRVVGHGRSGSWLLGPIWWGGHGYPI